VTPLYDMYRRTTRTPVVVVGGCALLPLSGAVLETTVSGSSAAVHGGEAPIRRRDGVLHDVVHLSVVAGEI